MGGVSVRHRGVLPRSFPPWILSRRFGIARDRPAAWRGIPSGWRAGSAAGARARAPPSAEGRARAGTERTTAAAGAAVAVSGVRSASPGSHAAAIVVGTTASARPRPAAAPPGRFRVGRSGRSPSDGAATRRATARRAARNTDSRSTHRLSHPQTIFCRQWSIAGRSLERESEAEAGARVEGSKPWVRRAAPAVRPRQRGVHGRALGPGGG